MTVLIARGLFVRDRTNSNDQRKKAVKQTYLILLYSTIYTNAIVYIP